MSEKINNGEEFSETMFADVAFMTLVVLIGAWDSGQEVAPEMKQRVKEVTEAAPMGTKVRGSVALLQAGSQLGLL